MSEATTWLNHWLTNFAPSASGALLGGDLPLDRLEAFCRAARHEQNASLVMMTAFDHFPATPRFELAVLLHVPGSTSYVMARIRLPDDSPKFPTVTGIFANANWPEREIRDMFGLEPVGHPDPRPLVWKGGWPQDQFPLRKDVRLDRAYPIQRVLFPVPRVEGEGIIEVPVGPIHAGIIEPGHFRFQAVGDTMLALDAQLFFCHRGIEKLAEGRDTLQALLLAERQCGTCSVSNALSFCLAVERAAGVVIPPRAALLRVILAEFERLYNHVNDVAAIAAGIGLAFVTQQGLRLKEELQRLAWGLSGHRFLRNVLVPGGVRRDIPTRALQELLERSQDLIRQMFEVTDTAFRHSVFLDRLETTGVLTTANAVALRVVGPPSRASGVADDTRVLHPYDGYLTLTGMKVPTHATGDCLARFRVRLDEVVVTRALLEEAIKALTEGPVNVAVPEPPAGAIGLGANESARGENLNLLRFDAGGRLSRYAVRTASYCNWPAIPTTVRGNIVPDFPLINKSFELCYADVDR